MNLRRQYVSWRAKYPLSSWLIGFVAGQGLITWAFPSGVNVSFLIQIVLILVATWTIWRRVWAIAAAFCLGILSALAVPVSVTESKLQNEVHYLVQVTDSPRYRQAGGVEVKLVILGKLEELNENIIPRAGQKVLCRAPDLPWKNSAQIITGAKFVMRADFRQVEVGLNPFSYPHFLARSGILATCRIRSMSKVTLEPLSLRERWLEGLRTLVTNQLGNGEVSGLILALTIGSRDQISRETEDVFKRTGLAHLLVVSGYQVSLIFYICYQLFYWLLTRSYWLPLKLKVGSLASIFGVILALIYAWLVGLDGSSLRAALAIGLVAVARELERGQPLFQHVMSAFFLMALIWPGCFFEPGTQLTFAALLGFCVALRQPSKNIFWAYLKICFWASVCTAGVTLAWFDTISIIGFLLNPLLAQIVSVFGFQVGWLGIFTLGAGLDSRAYMLSGLAYGLDSLRWLLWHLAELNWASLNLTGLAKCFGFICLGLLVATGLGYADREPKKL